MDIRYGVKLEAVELLQEWVRDVGSKAGLTPDNARINSGSVGVPESKLELEVEFETLAELEQFWAAIPPKLHKPWSQRMQHLVVHGSPTWELYRTVPAFGPQDLGVSVAASRARAPPALVLASDDDVGKYGGPPAPPSTAQTTSSGLSVVSGADEAAQVLDWKGDPMTINPGDKMPFRSF